MSNAISFLTLDQWQRVVESHPASTAFHHRNWIELLIRQYGLKHHIPAVKRGGQVVAAIPFLETKGLFGRRKLVSLPFSDSVPVLSTSSDGLELMRDAVQAWQVDDYDAIVVRSNEPLSGIASTSHCVRHVIDVDRPFNEIEREFRNSVVRNYRRAESRHLRFQCRTDPDAMEAFYKLHLMTRKKQGIPIQPKKFFARLHETVLQQGLGYVGVVSKDDQPLAAGVFLKYKETVIYKYGASAPRALEHRPNESLFYNAIRRTSEQGYSRFDFGVTAKNNDGLCRFKRKWGAAEIDAYQVYLSGEPQPELERLYILKLLSFVIRHSPTAVCRLFGEAFYQLSQ